MKPVDSSEIVSLCSETGHSWRWLYNSKEFPEEWQAGFGLYLIAIDDRIIVSKKFGHLNLSDSVRSRHIFTASFNSIPKSSNALIVIEDCSELIDGSIESISSYIHFMKSQKQISRVLFCGLSPYFKMAVKLGREMGLYPFAIAVYPTCREALVAAFDNKDIAVTAHREKRLPGVLTPPMDSGNVSEKALATVIGLVEDFQKLLNFTASINWNEPGLPPADEVLHEDNPLKSLYDTLIVIKHDFDSILEDRKKAQRKIVEENLLNQFRSDVWRLASDRNTGIIDFYHNLLLLIGVFLDADRTSFFELKENDQVFICKACWRKSGIENLTGISLPVSRMERYLEVKYSRVTDATLTETIPFSSDQTGEAEAMSLRDRFAMQTAYCIPFFINDQLTGIFLLDYCSPREESKEEFNLISRIGQNILAIAAAYVAQKKTEDERNELYAQLEQRVISRTAELVETNKQLSEARKVAETASDAKSQFLANMSHEIRTPLNAIIGFSEIITTTPDPLQHQSFAQNILSESKRLLELLNAVLDISKIESGKMEVVPQPFTLKKLIDELESTYGMQTRQKDLKFTYTYHAGLPSAVIGDSMKIRQVLVNLLGNAIKFTERGTITLTVSPSTAQGRIRFEVADTGIGMSDEAKRKLFKPFQQADASITRKYGGTGLGIAISFLLVQLMHGEINAQSEEGLGSTFWFELPLEPAPDSFIEKEFNADGKESSLVGKKVLIVEDYPPNREIAIFFLKAAGAQIEIAENGLAAVCQVMEKQFDLILMDVQMPVMDGLAATKDIRGLPFGKDVPIMGMTAYAFASDRDKCLAAGMNGVITKPVDWTKALAVLHNAVHGEIQQKDCEPAGAQNIITSGKPIDLDGYIQRMNGNKVMAMKILNGFLEILPKDIAAIGAAIASGNSREANRLAHSIKGGAGNVCAVPLGEAARQLEESLEIGISDDAAGLLAMVETEYSQLRKWLESIPD